MQNPGLSLDQVRERAARIRCVFLDIDGVMTDCKLYLGPDGMEIKAVNVKDGLGIKNLLRNGIEVAVISGRPSEAMQRRLEHLGLRHIRLATEDKLPAYREIIASLGLTDEQCAHMGDDTPDLPLMRRVGLALCVADGHPKAIAASHWVSRYRGGDGAIREAADLILEAQGIDA
ncbi:MULTISPECIES: KdsC family phosphatase [Hydrocarboniphaga]|uniref:3-deoxy-D-manno-octulosonate 8-phosphate phosphatase KdsC n=1 Tax=Hydrocarboniphaga effusa AP103 TaxID=1172194 RepID=I8T5Y3_9GAMM|nr:MULTISPECIES: HAD hydrolase family protein [Hydrocarboniphaga]EIT69143.1 YrbI family phosphatase [Hydrocarboniphaga effusa AP103]MDZ4081005.1 HAD hydrolase family protein [Hydrocarboniphaga sp.]